MARGISIAVVATVLSLCCNSAWGQTDEIQVYNGEIVDPGQFGVTLHNNYTPIGRTEADFPGGVVPEHAWNGVPEYAYGMADWWEIGMYLPVYTLTRERRAELDSVKLRTLFTEPHVADRNFFYAVNFELSYNARHWEPTRMSAEMRPIVGFRYGSVDLIVNPIFDLSFRGVGSLDFAPCERLDYNFSKDWTVAAEAYQDFGQVRRLQPLSGEQQTLFAVVDYNGEPIQVEAGIGHGFTAASDGLVLKLMLTREF